MDFTDNINKTYMFNSSKMEINDKILNSEDKMSFAELAGLIALIQ